MMNREQRLEQIVGKVRAERREVSVEEIAEMFGITASTVRRDLAELNTRGVVLRTHGGAVTTEHAAGESEYHAKVACNYAQKQAIGRAAAAALKAGETILISDGSTNFHLAASLAGVGRLTVYTNSIEMTIAMSRVPEIDIHVLGGRYSRRTHCLGGSLTSHILDQLMFDTVFLGTDGIDSQGRCLVADPAEAAVAIQMLARGRRKVLLADHTKVSDGGYTAYAGLDAFDQWITSKGMPKPVLKKFKRMTEVVEV